MQTTTKVTIAAAFLALVALANREPGPTAAQMAAPAATAAPAAKPAPKPSHYMSDSIFYAHETEKAKHGRMLYETRNAPSVQLSDVQTALPACFVNGKPARIAAMQSPGSLVLGCYRWQGDTVLVKWAGMDGDWIVMAGDKFREL